MKKYILLVVVFFAMKISFAQVSEKVIPIHDIRKAGIYNMNDSSVIGFKEGDVTVDRTYRGLGKMNDSAEMYLVHFYKIYNNKLRSYSSAYGKAEDYDKASYKWVNDTTVAVNLINTSTNKVKNIFVFQSGMGAGVGTYDASMGELKDLLEGKKVFAQVMEYDVCTTINKVIKDVPFHFKNVKADTTKRNEDVKSTIKIKGDSYSWIGWKDDSWNCRINPAIKKDTAELKKLYKSIQLGCDCQIGDYIFDTEYYSKYPIERFGWIPLKANDKQYKKEFKIELVCDYANNWIDLKVKILHDNK